MKFDRGHLLNKNLKVTFLKFFFFCVQMHMKSQIPQRALEES